MKVKAVKLANGYVQLNIGDNSRSNITMKFANADTMKELGEMIIEESGRMKAMETHFRQQEQKMKIFG